jgi:hypothetical protein
LAKDSLIQDSECVNTLKPSPLGENFIYKKSFEGRTAGGSTRKKLNMVDSNVGLKKKTTNLDLNSIDVPKPVDKVQFVTKIIPTTTPRRSMHVNSKATEYLSELPYWKNKGKNKIK